MQTLQSDLSEQYHACVPLGWNPVPVIRRYYYPGYTSEYREEGVWLHPAWLGAIPVDRLSDANVRTAYDVLDALVRAGMVLKVRVPGAFRYRLTMNAMPYYFEDDSFKNNPDRLPYLCYSRILPNRVLRIEDVRPSRTRTTFEWRVVAVGAWAPGSYLREHSVILPPISNPSIAVISHSEGSSYVTKLETPAAMLPVAADPGAWP